MPRSKFSDQREVLPMCDIATSWSANSSDVLMSGGKKSTAERICYGAFDAIQEKTGGDPLKVFRAAIDNVKPIVEVKSRRVGGASYQVPVEIRPARRVSLALAMDRLNIRGRAAEKACGKSWLPSCSTHPIIQGLQSKNGKTYIGWLRRIKRSPIIAGNVVLCCS